MSCTALHTPEIFILLYRHYHDYLIIVSERFAEHAECRGFRHTDYSSSECF